MGARRIRLGQLNLTATFPCTGDAAILRLNGRTMPPTCPPDLNLTGVKKLLTTRMVHQTMDAEMAALDRTKALVESRP